MPKDIIRNKKDNRIFITKPPRKFKIGTRKSGKSAHTMSNDDLLEVLGDASKSRYHQNSREVLSSRGISA